MGLGTGELSVDSVCGFAKSFKALVIRSSTDAFCDSLYSAAIVSRLVASSFRICLRPSL